MCSKRIDHAHHARGRPDDQERDAEREREHTADGEPENDERRRHAHAECAFMREPVNALRRAVDRKATPDEHQQA